MKKGIYGYSLGSLSDTGLYSFINSYFLLFLTTVAEIESSVAGTIISISLISEAVCAVIFGRWSDDCRSRFGRRRPFILGFGLLYCVSLCLLFVKIDASPTVTVLYYAVLGFIMKGAYSGYYTPYVALGSNITDDYDERTRIRSICKIFSAAGNLLGYISPLLLINALINHGVSKPDAWLSFTIFLSVMLYLPILISWKMTASYDQPADALPPHRESLLKMCASYFELLKLKPMTFFLLFKIMFNISYIFQSNAMLFFLLYKLNLSESVSSITYVTMVLLSFFSVPLIDYLGIRLGKSGACKGIFLFSGGAGLLLMLIGVNSLVMAILYVAVYYISNCAFWQICYSMLYDICDADELCFCKRREGDIMSFQSLIPTFFSAAATQLLGVILSVSGFDTTLEVQSASVHSALDLVFIAIPCATLILGALFLQFYSLKKPLHREILHVLNQRKNGTPDRDAENRLKKTLLFSRFTPPSPSAAPESQR